MLLNDVTACFDKCEKEEVLCTLGIQPSHPNTGFGYIEYEKTAADSIKKVAQFREKPDLETAKEFLAQGNFLWNAGIFMWSVSTIVNAFKKYQSEQFDLFNAGISCYNSIDEQAFIAENYPKNEVDFNCLMQEFSKGTKSFMASALCMQEIFIKVQ